MNTSNIRHECFLFAQKMMELNPNVMIDFSVFDPEEQVKIWRLTMETNPNSLDGMFESLDYYDLWYNWFIKSPSNKELMKFKQMNKQQQYDYLKEQVNGK